MIGFKNIEIRTIAMSSFIKGKRVSGAISEPTVISGSIQPISVATQQVLPDAIRQTAKYQLFTFQLLNPFTSLSPNQVLLNNEWFDICALADYSDIIEHGEYVLFIQKVGI